LNSLITGKYPIVIVFASLLFRNMRLLRWSTQPNIIQKSIWKNPPCPLIPNTRLPYAMSLRHRVFPK